MKSSEKLYQLENQKFELPVKFISNQVEVFDNPAPNVVYVKGRRAGGTHGAVNRLVEIAHKQPGSRHLWIDTIHRNIGRYLRQYFFPLLKGTRFSWNEQLKVLTFETGAYCDFGSAQKPEYLEGFAYDFIWVNEAGSVLRNESIYFNTLLPMALESPGAQIFLIGSPKGPGLFQRMFDWGQDEQRPEWASFRHSSYLNPFLPPRALKSMRENMPDRVFRQEVLAEFLESEGAVFRNVDAIAQRQPESEPDSAAPYVLGVDLARYEDFTVIWAGRADQTAGVACDRFRRIPWHQQTERIAALSRRYGDAPLFIDASGLGDAVVEDLARSGLPVQRVTFSARRKRHLIDHLAIGIERGELTIVPHEPTLRELRAYEYRTLSSGHVRTEGAGGEHDDCVIALALCFWGMTNRNSGFILGSNMVTSELD